MKIDKKVQKMRELARKWDWDERDTKEIGIWETLIREGEVMSEYCELQMSQKIKEQCKARIIAIDKQLASSVPSVDNPVSYTLNQAVLHRERAIWMQFLAIYSKDYVSEVKSIERKMDEFISREN